MIRIENFHGLSIADMTRKYKGSKNKREAERWLAVKMIAMDHTVPFVASILGHDERSIRSWIKGFNDRGSEGLIYEPPEGQKKNSLGKISFAYQRN